MSPQRMVTLHRTDNIAWTRGPKFIISNKATVKKLEDIWKPTGKLRACGIYSAGYIPLMRLRHKHWKWTGTSHADKTEQLNTTLYTTLGTINTFNSGAPAISAQSQFTLVQLGIEFNVWHCNRIVESPANFIVGFNQKINPNMLAKQQWIA